jgi:hypothetical protein
MGNFISEHEEPSESMDILASIFFVVAGIWLVLAMGYSCTIVLFLRMRARGQLDAIYDEDFGRIYLPCTNNSNCRLYIPTGCLFRRYLHRLQQEQQRQQPSSSSSSSRTDAEVATAARYMTTEERRRAMEVLLCEDRDTVKAVHSCAVPVALPASAPVPLPASAPTSTDTDTRTADQADSDLEEGEGPMCLICLEEFNEPDATVLQSPTCSHLYHKDCIMDWLQRQGTRECPGCRVAMITEDEVWEAVQCLRKERRTKLRRDTVWSYMFRRESEEMNNSSNATRENSENSDDDDAMMVSPTLTSDTASSEEEEVDTSV